MRIPMFSRHSSEISMAVTKSIDGAVYHDGCPDNDIICGSSGNDAIYDGYVCMVTYMSAELYFQDEHVSRYKSEENIMIMFRADYVRGKSTQEFPVFDEVILAGEPSAHPPSFVAIGTASVVVDPTSEFAKPIEETFAVEADFQTLAAAVWRLAAVEMIGRIDPRWLSPSDFCRRSRDKTGRSSPYSGADRGASVGMLPHVLKQEAMLRDRRKASASVIEGSRRTARGYSERRRIDGRTRAHATPFVAAARTTAVGACRQQEAA